MRNFVYRKNWLKVLDFFDLNLCIFSNVTAKKYFYESRIENIELIVFFVVYGIGWDIGYVGSVGVEIKRSVPNFFGIFCHIFLFFVSFCIISFFLRYIYFLFLIVFIINCTHC